MPAFHPIPPSLEDEWSRLAGRSVLLENDPEGLLALLEDLVRWIEKAVAQDWPPAGAYLSQVLTLIQGLKAGRPVTPALQRLRDILDQMTLGEGEDAPSPADAPQSVAPTTPGLFHISEEELPGFQDFMGEAPRHLDNIEVTLLALGQGADADVLQICRPFHTLKGICGFMNLTGLNQLAHKAESLLEPYKSSGLRMPAGLADLLFPVLDLFRRQVKLIGEGMEKRAFPLLDNSELLRRLEKDAEVPAAEGNGAENAENNSHQMKGLDDRSIRIGVEKMDALLEAVGELSICQTQVTEGVLGLNVTGTLSSEAGRLGKISRELRDIVLSLRMVPIQALLTRMARAARDLARQTGKEVAVHLAGGETELDKRLVEEIAEPMLHLLRNAVDHGFEKTEERRRVGKPEVGQLHFRASHQGGDFVLEVEDDGRGLDAERIKIKALEKGLLKSGEEVTHEKLVDLIFAAGFTTAERLTDVSGRGVGLDAVRRKIEELKGALRVESERGKGCLFILRIPLTLALMDGILLRVGDNRYVLPAAQVRRFWAFRTTQEHELSKGKGWIETKEGNLPLVDLAHWFKGRSDRGEQTVVVEVESAGRVTTLLADEILGKQQVVIKPLAEALGRVKGVSGGAVLGDGRVGLILDVNALTAWHEAVHA